MIVTPLITEKSHTGANTGAYTFKVPNAASKPEVAKAVAAQFKVTVTAVRISRRPDKKRQRGRIAGRRPGFKKAIVQLKAGDKITQLEG